MEDTTDLTTINSFHKSSLASPCLVTFEYGSLAKDEAAKLRCSMYVDRNIPDKQTLVVSKGNQYYKGKLNSKALCQTSLLIRNRKTNKARIISAFTCMLESSLKERTQQKITVNSISDSSANLSSLNQLFGSKKAKRISDLGMRLNLNSSSLQDDVKKLIADFNVKGKELDDMKASSDDTIIQLLPPSNREAERIEDVYKVEDILSEMDLNSLEKAVTLLEDENERKSEFLQKHLTYLESDPPKEKLKLLIYADSLLKFVNMGAIEIKNKNCVRNICPSSKVIGTKILNDFTILTGNSRNRPVSYKDRAVCYMMILVLLSCNFKMNFEFISSLMKGYHQRKLLQLCRVVGVVPVTENGQKLHILKVPLPKLPAIPHKKK